MKRSFVLVLAAALLALSACAADARDPGELPDDATVQEAGEMPAKPGEKLAKPEPDPWKRTIHAGRPTGASAIAKPEPDPWKDEPAQPETTPDPTGGAEVQKPEPDPWNPGATDTTGTTKH